MSSSWTMGYGFWKNQAGLFVYSSMMMKASDFGTTEKGVTYVSSLSEVPSGAKEQTDADQKERDLKTGSW